MYISLYSGGLGSWAATKRLVARVGIENVRLLFTDTKIEDYDLYRFLKDSGRNIGAKSIIRLTEGRTPWEVYRDVRYIGNSRIDPCSKILKRDITTKWIAEHYPDPKSVTRVYGFDWSEQHRLRQAKEAVYPVNAIAPLAEEEPYLDKRQIIKWAESEGLIIPRLYKMGFSHNNCGGFCCKAGQGHFYTLLKMLPDVYAKHEQEELDTIKHIGKKVTILHITRNGVKIYITLQEFRIMVEKGEIVVDKFDIGGCACFG